MNEDFLSRLREPPRPEFAETLYRKISKDANGKRGFRGQMAERVAVAIQGSISGKKLALGMASVALLTILGVVLVPSLWAQITEYSKPVMVFRAPGGNGMATTSDWPGFQPLNPTYLPPGRWEFSFGGRDEGGIKYLVLTYLQGSGFIRISESQARPDEALPKGESRQVNGRPAVIVSGLRGTLEFTTITFSDGEQLSWDVGDARIDLLSNLPEQEMMQVAESLKPVEKRDAKFLPQPEGPDAPYPLDTPSVR